MFGEGGFNCILLIWHPEHDLLFIATQVARVAGYNDSSATVHQAAQRPDFGPTLKLFQVTSIIHQGVLPTDVSGRVFNRNSTLFTESQTYQMLLRGHAPASEPFRKWVTEEVLPSIRKTGSYDIGTSKTPEAQQLSMDYGGLRALIENMAI